MGREKGCRYMLAVALVYSATSNLGKVGVLSSSASFFGIAYTFAVAAVWFLYLLASGEWRTGTDRGGVLLWVLGAAMAAMIVLHFTAIEMTQVAYMISVKRSSLIFSVFLGWIFLGEERPGRRLAGAAVMCGGMALIIVN